MKRKILILLICILLVWMLPIKTVANQINTGSQPSSWALPEIEKAKEHRLTTEKVLSNYQQNITREEFCELVIKLYERLSGKTAQIPSTSKFTDTKNSEVLEANALGIVNGVNETTFTPGNNITRQEIAVMFYRTLKAVDRTLIAGKYEVAFADKSDISIWAVDAVAFISNKGILRGVGENKVEPKGNTSREEAIALVIRTYEKLYDSTSKKESKLQVHFIDVGQADSILIFSGTAAILIDAGNTSDGINVVNYIKSNGISKLDYVIGTHPHADHIGGLSDVIKAFEIGKIIMPKVQANTKTFEDLIDIIAGKGLKITSPIPGTKYYLGSTEFEILAPNSSSYQEINDYSVVIKLNFGSTSFLFTGDAEAISEGEMISKGYDLKSDVLKVGHHGSKSSTTEKFLKAVAPKYAVICVGKDNQYGHPAYDTIKRINDAGIKVFRTDEADTIVMESDGEVIKIDVKASSIKPQAPPPEQEFKYIGNKNTKKFHLTTCRSLPAEINRVFFKIRDEAVKAEYDPCEICKP